MKQNRDERYWIARRGWTTEMYLSTVSETVMQADITIDVLKIELSNHYVNKIYRFCDERKTHSPGRQAEYMATYDDTNVGGMWGKELEERRPEEMK